jgi:hypothetical protein
MRQTQKEKWGFIDKTGKWAIQPQFENVGHFSEGLASALQNGKWGFIDKAGKWIIQPQIESKWRVYEFQDGMAEISLSGSLLDKGVIGFIDKTGRWVIQPQFFHMNFFEGLALKYQNGWGYIRLLYAEEYITEYINKKIAPIQQKDEFETTAEYKQRTANIDTITKEFFNEAVKAYIASPLFSVATSRITVSRYDADNRTFLLTSEEFGNLVMKIDNIEEARQFKNNAENLNFMNANFTQTKDKTTGVEKIILSSLTVENPQNGKQYVWSINDNYKYEQ